MGRPQAGPAAGAAAAGRSGAAADPRGRDARHRRRHCRAVDRALPRRGGGGRCGPGARLPRRARLGRQCRQPARPVAFLRPWRQGGGRRRCRRPHPAAAACIHRPLARAGSAARPRLRDEDHRRADGRRNRGASALPGRKDPRRAQPRHRLPGDRPRGSRPARARPVAGDDRRRLLSAGGQDQSAGRHPPCVGRRSRGRRPGVRPHRGSGDPPRGRGLYRRDLARVLARGAARQCRRCLRRADRRHARARRSRLRRAAADGGDRGGGACRLPSRCPCRPAPDLEAGGQRQLPDRRRLDCRP